MHSLCRRLEDLRESTEQYRKRHQQRDRTKRTVLEMERCLSNERTEEERKEREKEMDVGVAFCPGDVTETADSSRSDGSGGVDVDRLIRGRLQGAVSRALAWVETHVRF